MPVSGNIRKFKFDLSLSEDKAFEPLSNDLLRLAKKNLLDVIEKVFSNFDGKNIVVDKIEIDLGNFKASDLDSIVRKFESELEDFVQNKLNQSTLQNQERVSEAVLFFIRKGYFPWWVDGADAFNEMILKMKDSLLLSERIKSILTANKKNYFRLFNVLNPETQKIVYQKLFSQNETIFQASISFFEYILINYQLPKIESQYYIMEEVEFFLVRQYFKTPKDPSSLFFKALKYFSNFLSIPFSNLFRFILDEVIHAQSNQVIRSLIEHQTDVLKDFTPSEDDVLNKINLNNNFESGYYLNSVEGLIYYLENDIPQLIYSEIEELKQLFDALIEQPHSKLLSYLKSVAFYNNGGKLARLIILLDAQNYKFLIKYLSLGAKKLDSLISISDFIRRYSQDIKLIALSTIDNKEIHRGEEREQRSISVQGQDDVLEKSSQSLSAEEEQAKRLEREQLSTSEQGQVEGLEKSTPTLSAEEEQAKRREREQLSTSEHGQVEDLEESSQTLSTEEEQAKRSEREQLSTSEQGQVEGLEKSTPTLSAEEEQAKRLEKEQLLFSKQGQVSKVQKIEVSDLKQLINFLEEASLRISFTFLKEQKKILDILLEKRDKNLFDYLSAPTFYKNQQKLSRLISLLSNENYQILVALLSKNKNQLDSIQHINDFIIKTSQESELSDLSSNNNLELTNEEVVNTRLLSEDPLSILSSYFEKGISQANFTILSEYSRILELLLETNVQSLIDYLTKKNFFGVEIRLERFFSLLSEKSLQKLIDLLGVDELKLLINDLDTIFSEKSFIQNVSSYIGSSNIAYKYKKSILVDLLVNKTKKHSPFSFISSFIDRLTKESSLGSNELLFEFLKMRDKKKHVQSVSNILEALYVDPDAVESGSLKSESKASEASERSVTAASDMLTLLALTSNELTQLLIDLFRQLPNSRLALEKFVFHQDYSKVLTLDLFSKFFQSLKEISGIDYSKHILSIINLIDPQRKNQFLLLINKVAFQIIVSEGIKTKPEDFSEALTTTMINLYPQIFKKYIAEKKVTVSVEENTLQQLIKKVSERSKSKTKNKEQPIDIEKFDSLLRLKQDILENQLSAIFSEEIIDFHDSFDSIMNSEETLLAFLNQNYMDHELIMSFSEITLQSTTSGVLDKIINKKNSTILQFEEELLEIQKRHNIISLNTSSFKIILRTFLFKKIGAINDFKGFSVPEFAIDFLEDIKRENYLNFQRLAFFLRSEELENYTGTLVDSLMIFNTSSKFSVTNPKLKNELFYKDLVFNFLEMGKLPEWANIENFTLNDAILFIKSAIAIGDKLFLTKLFTTEAVVKRLLDSLGELTLSEIKKIYQLVHFKSASFELHKIFELLESYFEKTNLSASLPNSTFFLYLTLREELWMQTSLITFVEKLFPFIQSKSKKTKKQILIFISSEFNISNKLIELEKSTVFSDFELIEVLKYYLEFNQFPKHLKLYTKEIELQLKQILLKEGYILKELLREFKLKPQVLERLFSFISLEAIIDSFHESSFKEQTISVSLGPALKEFIKLPNFKKKSKRSLLINLASSFEYRVTKTALTNFYQNIKKEDAKGFDQFISILREKIKTTGIEDLDQQNELLEEVTLSQQTKELVKKETLENIDLLDYYLEIGSVNFENRSLSKNELYQILLKSIKNAELRSKKMIYEWVKSSLKLNRLMGIIPKNEQKLLMNLIHPDLFRKISLFSVSMEQVLKTSIEKLLSVKTKTEIELKIIQYWLKKSIYLDSPFHLIVHLFEEVLENQQLTSTGFFKDFRDADFDYPLETSNFIFTLKRTYDNYKNQLSEADLSIKEGEDADPEQEDTDAIVIQNAGLIILWPFFYRLFDKCGFLIDRKFKDDLSTQKGILMMQYLVTGSLDVNENELVLNKILCGVAQRTPIDVTIELEDVELEMCESLLKGVLQNWEKLNNSSVATLRETFLKREGILTPNESDYNLDIVKETFDMLLETIPWNISMIQTTFMENRINVDWK
jgi:hypothetical protein